MDSLFRPVPGLGIPRPPGLGKVFFVEGEGGSDSHEGVDPNYPLETVQAAIDKTANWMNDYVVVMRRASSDHPATTAILMNKHTTKLIALSNGNPNPSLVRLVHDGETDNVIEFPQDLGFHCEIAGFAFGGGATAKGGIAVTGGGGGHVGVWIHHCNFGSILTKGTPDFGVMNDGLGAEMMEWVIEDCTFYGSGDLAAGLLAVSGVKAIHSPGILTASKNLIIQRCVFLSLPSFAIHLDGVQGAQILNNTFKLPSNLAGGAITLGNDCRGCWVDGNSANWGDNAAMAAIPWVDSAADDKNSWGYNLEGNAPSFPA